MEAAEAPQLVNFSSPTAWFGSDLNAALTSIFTSIANASTSAWQLFTTFSRQLVKLMQPAISASSSLTLPTNRKPFSVQLLQQHGTKLRHSTVRLQQESLLLVLFTTLLPFPSHKLEMLNYKKKYNINQPIELPVLILDRKMDKEIIKDLPKKQMAGEHFWQSCYSHMGPLEFNKSDNRESTEMEIGALLHSNSSKCLFWICTSAAIYNSRLDIARVIFLTGRKTE